jgi:hypothetical protein
MSGKPSPATLKTVADRKQELATKYFVQRKSYDESIISKDNITSTGTNFNQIVNQTMDFINDNRIELNDLTEVLDKDTGSGKKQRTRFYDSLTELYINGNRDAYDDAYDAYVKGFKGKKGANLNENYSAFAKDFTDSGRVITERPAKGTAPAPTPTPPPKEEEEEKDRDDEDDMGTPPLMPKPSPDSPPDLPLPPPMDFLGGSGGAGSGSTPPPIPLGGSGLFPSAGTGVDASVTAAPEVADMGTDPEPDPDMVDMGTDPIVPDKPVNSQTITEEAIPLLPNKTETIPNDRLNTDFKNVAELNDDIKYFLKNYSSILSKEARLYRKVNKKNIEQLKKLHKMIVGIIYSPALTGDSSKLGLVVDADKYITDKINQILLAKTLAGLRPEDLVIDIEGKVENPNESEYGSYKVIKNQNGRLNAEKVPVYRSLPSTGSIFNSKQRVGQHLNNLPLQQWSEVVVAKREARNTEPRGLFIPPKRNVRFDKLF